MGMSSPEWSRYMHDELGLPRAAGGDQRRGRAAHARRATATELPLLDGAVDAVRAARRRSFRSRVASSSNRPLIDAVLETRGLAPLLRGDRLLRGGRRAASQPGRLPRGGAAARRRPRARVPRSRTRANGIRAAHGGRHARDRDPERALSADRGGARARRRRARRRSASSPRGGGGAPGDRLSRSTASDASSYAIVAAEQDAAVVAAEAHRVRERDVELAPARASFGT